jgi:hypothetical protein
VAGQVAEPRYQALKDQGFQAYFFVAETASGQVPDADYCKQIRSQYGLTMPVLYGDADILAPLGIVGSPNDWSLVIANGGQLLLRQKSGQTAVANAINGEL